MAGKQTNLKSFHNYFVTYHRSFWQHQSSESYQAYYGIRRSKWFDRVCKASFDRSDGQHQNFKHKNDQANRSRTYAGIYLFILSLFMIGMNEHLFAFKNLHTQMICFYAGLAERSTDSHSNKCDFLVDYSLRVWKKTCF